MKLKIFITLLFLAGSAYSQLITTREESGFMSSYPDGAQLTFASNGGSVPFHVHGSFQSSLSFRENVTPVLAENPGFGASPHSLGLHRFAGYSVAGGESPASSNATAAAFLDVTPATQADAFPISQDQGVFALLAASTLP